MGDFVVDLNIIFVCSALLACLAVRIKQPIIVAYILCGALAGPFGLGWVRDVELIELISHLGITLLLFLAGLCLHPRRLLKIFKKTTLVTFIGCLSSFVIAFFFAMAVGFTRMECLCIGFALMFSSTILVLKLLPTSEVHHGRMGGICIGILILQDLLAIAVLAFIRCLGQDDGALWNFIVLSVKLIGFIGCLLVVEYFIVRRLLSHMDRFHEVLFVVGIAWCVGVSHISNQMGLFYETGAFFAGVALAGHSIAKFIYEQLKPVRDFFLILFFFSLGGKLNWQSMEGLLIPAILLAAIFMAFKPWIFRWSFNFIRSEKKHAREVGFRLGQLSEFSLLIAVLALQEGHIGEPAAHFIQWVTILTFVASSYLVVYRFATPIGVSANLIRD